MWVYALVARRWIVKQKTMYDYMREADNSEEDGFFPEDWMEDRKKTQKEEYFEFYDDIKTTPKDDW